MLFVDALVQGRKVVSKQARTVERLPSAKKEFFFYTCTLYIVLYKGSTV
jgi:hypothetical protein